YDDFGVKINPDDYKDITSSSLLPRHRYGFPRQGQGADADGPHTNGHDRDDGRQFLPESSLQRMYSAAEPEEIPSKIEVHRQTVQVGVVNLRAGNSEQKAKAKHLCNNSRIA